MSGEWESVRRIYGVKARRGLGVTFTGFETPLRGRLTYCNGQYVWMRREDNGEKLGPLHPTWKIEYE
jgi:hypothetical protein